MEFVVLGLVVGVVVGAVSAGGRRRARRSVVAGPVVDESALGLPSRQRDPETGELL